MRDLAEQLLAEAGGQRLQPTGEKTWQGGNVYRMDIRKDQFVHFTQEDRARQILDSGKLLMRPPYEKFGIDAVTAVSLVYGESLPSVQMTHSKGKLVAIMFRTSTKPQEGRVEEVIWKRDVVLKGAKIISAKNAVAMLRNTPERIESEDLVEY